MWCPSGSGAQKPIQNIPNLPLQLTSKALDGCLRRMCKLPEQKERTSVTLVLPRLFPSLSRWISSHRCRFQRLHHGASPDHRQDEDVLRLLRFQSGGLRLDHGGPIPPCKAPVSSDPCPLAGHVGHRVLLSFANRPEVNKVHQLNFTRPSR